MSARLLATKITKTTYLETFIELWKCKYAPRKTCREVKSIPPQSGGLTIHVRHFCKETTRTWRCNIAHRKSVSSGTACPDVCRKCLAVQYTYRKGSTAQHHMSVGRTGDVRIQSQADWCLGSAATACRKKGQEWACSPPPPTLFIGIFPILAKLEHQIGKCLSGKQQDAPIQWTLYSTLTRFLSAGVSLRNFYWGRGVGPQTSDDGEGGIPTDVVAYETLTTMYLTNTCMYLDSRK